MVRTMTRAVAFVTISAALSATSALTCTTSVAAISDVCGEAALIADSDGGAALSLMQRRAGLTSRAALLERAQSAVWMAQREAAEGGGPELSVDEARELAMKALGGAGLSILGEDWGSVSSDHGAPSEADSAANEFEGEGIKDIPLDAVSKAHGHEKHAGAGAKRHTGTKKGTGLDKEVGKFKSSEERDSATDSEVVNDDKEVAENVTGSTNGSEKVEALHAADRNTTASFKEARSPAASHKVADREGHGHAAADAKMKEAQEIIHSEEEDNHNVSLAENSEHLVGADANHRARRREIEAEMFLLPDNVSFAATSHGRVYPASDAHVLAAASSEMWGNWHMSENRTEPPPASPQATMLRSQPAREGGGAEDALEHALADFKTARDLTGTEAARAAHQLLGTAAAAAAAASGRLQRFTRHEGSHCTGSELDLLSSWSGTHDECAEKCIDLGPSCTGFVRVADTGTSDPSLAEGRCFFRSGEVSKQKHQTSECYVRRYHVHRGESCGWGPTIGAACGWANQLNISAAGGRSTEALTDEEEICGGICDQHEECGGFNYHHRTCFYRRSTTCGDVLHREKGTACYTKVPASK